MQSSTHFWLSSEWLQGIALVHRFCKQLIHTELHVEYWHCFATKAQAFMSNFQCGLILLRVHTHCSYIAPVGCAHNIVHPPSLYTVPCNVRGAFMSLSLQGWSLVSSSASPLSMSTSFSGRRTCTPPTTNSWIRPLSPRSAFSRCRVSGRLRNR